MNSEATGKNAFSVGKHSSVIMRAARKYLVLEAREKIIIGDTMNPDILGGVQRVYTTILNLSGVSKRENLVKFAFKPDLIVKSVAEINLEKVLSPEVIKIEPK